MNSAAAQALPALPLYSPPDPAELQHRPALRVLPAAREARPRGRRLERGLLAAAVLAAHLGGLAALLHFVSAPDQPPAITPIQIALIPAEPSIQPVAPEQPPAPREEPKPTPPPPPKVERVEPPPKPRTPPRKPAPPKPAPPKPAPTPEAVTSSPSALTQAEAAPPPPVAPPAPAVTAPVAAAPAPVIAARFDAAYLNNPTPTYPMLSRRMREEGQVMLRVLVSAEGLPARIELRTSSGSERLDRAAQDAVARWRFVPARRGDEAIEAWVLVPIVFKLQGS